MPSTCAIVWRFRARPATASSAWACRISSSATIRACRRSCSIGTVGAGGVARRIRRMATKLQDAPGTDDRAFPGHDFLPLDGLGETTILA